MTAASVAYAVAVLMVAGGAQAHNAPKGWAYASECCAGQDCAPIVGGGVHATPSGWLIDETGETIPYGDRRLKVSQDDAFHRCRFASPILLHEERRSTRCLYVPPQGF